MPCHGVLQDMSDSESDEEDLLAGLVRPNLVRLAAGGSEAGGGDDEGDDGDAGDAGAGPATGGDAANKEAEEGQHDDDDDEEEEDDGVTFEGGVDADVAFELATAPDALELDPFRVAKGADVPDIAERDAGAKPRKGSKDGGGPIPRRIYVGGLAPGTTDDALVRFFARYGKVQEATAVSGKSFGFVTFVSEKGSRYCLQQAGDPPTVTIEGRQCTVRQSQQKDTHGARQHKMPARGNVDYLGPGKRSTGAGSRSDAGGGGGGGPSHAGQNSDMGAPGIAMIAQAHKRALPDSAPSRSGGGGGGGSSSGGAPSGYEHNGKRKKNEIVTVSKRQDAEPLHKKPITMKEIFPKEFWRI